MFQMMAMLAIDTGFGSLLLVSTWTSKMAKIMDPILRILITYTHYFGLFGRSR